MFNLLKYELRKTIGLKGIILILVAIMQVAFLIGLYGEYDNMLVISIFGLTFGTFASLIVIGLYSIFLLSKDLNTKQSYMLFMTPNNSYKILGAKVIENSLSIIITGAFFILLGAIDISLGFAKYGSLEDIIEFFNYFLTDLQQITPETVIASVSNGIISWIFIVTTAFFAVVLCATLFNGKRHNGLLSFIVFIVLNSLVSYVIGKILGPSDVNITVAYNLTMIAIHLVLSVVMYFVTAWIMDNKLSV